MNDFSKVDLFALKSVLEGQIERDFVDGVSAQDNGAFDFLIGEWDLVRSNYDANGNVARTKGSVVARYVFAGGAIQENFYNLRDDGAAYRAGTALYTYSPSSDQWHVAAIDVSTGATSYNPVVVDGEVRYESTVKLPGRDIFTKSRIFNIAGDSNEWEQQVSIDGELWFPNYHIASYRRADAGRT